MKNLKSQISNLKSPPLLALFAGAITLLRLALAQTSFSPAIDETSYIGSGISMLEAHKLIAPGQHPPLTKLVVALPLWLDGCRLPQCRGQTEIGTEDLGYKLGTQVLYYGPKPFDVLLSRARLAMLVFPAIALLYVYLLGRRLAGPSVGLASVLFFSVDPTFLGNSLWIYSDAAGCAGFLAALYHGLRWLEVKSWRSAGFASLAFGLAFSTKFSCFLLIPVFLIFLLLKLKKTGLPRRRLLIQTAVILAASFLVLWSTYFFNIGPLSDQAGLNNPPGKISAEAAALQQKWQSLSPWLRNTPIPMPSFFLALARLVAHSRAGHLAYLNGQTRTLGWWYYFPELLLIKSTVAFLIALLLAIPISFRHPAGRAVLLPAVLIPAGIYLFFAVTSHIDIGIRHILPVIPLLHLFTAWALTRPRWIWALAVLICLSAVESAAVHPDYASFFNLAVGGPKNGDRYALDSNLDLNQDLYRLAAWLKTNAHNRPYALRLSGQRNKPILAALDLNPAALDAPPHGNLLCISKNMRLVFRDLPWLSQRTPVAQIGATIDVYDLTGPALPNEPDDTPSADDPSAAQ